MKRYMPTSILLVVDVIFIVTFNLNSRVLEDGTLKEPFFLIPLIYIVTLTAIILAIVAFIRSRNYKKQIYN